MAKHTSMDYCLMTTIHTKGHMFFVTDRLLERKGGGRKGGREEGRKGGREEGRKGGGRKEGKRGERRLPLLCKLGREATDALCDVTSRVLCESRVLCSCDRYCNI